MCPLTNIRTKKGIHLITSTIFRRCLWSVHIPLLKVGKMFLFGTRIPWRWWAIRSANDKNFLGLLRNKLKDCIRSKCRVKLTKGVRLLHDNAPIHTAAISEATIRECGFQELKHPTYSLDIAPRDNTSF